MGKLRMRRSKPTSTTNGSTSTTTVSPTTIPPIMKAVYINSFDTICGIAAEEDILLNWCKKYSINTMYLYSLNTVLSTTTKYTALSNFINKAKAAGITKFFGFRSSESSNIGTGTSSNKSYNASQSTNKINYSFEDEFWNYDSETGTPPGADANGNSTWSVWLPQQQNIYATAKSQGLSSDFYIGHVRDLIDNTPTETIAAGLVSYTDRIHISCYISSSSMDTVDGAFNNIKTRLEQLGSAALLLNKKIDVVVIFSAVSTDSYNYFLSNSFQKAYDKVVSSFNNTYFVGKGGINLVGWNVYGYQQAKTL
jgi:hypothetical protein